MVELISVHIPKTAGTAFRHVLTDIYGINGVLGDYPPDRIYQPQNPISHNIKAIHGHFEPSKYCNYFPEAKRIVWLRHPIFRLISEYFFAKTIKDRNNVIHVQLLDKNLNILEFARIPQMQNFLTQKIEGIELREFDFVGIQEFYLQDLVEMQKMMGWRSFQPIVKNSNRYPQYQQCLQEILNDSSLVDRLAKLNREDMELYREALHLRGKRRQESILIQSTLADWQRSQFLLQQIQYDLARAKMQVQQNIYWSGLMSQRSHSLKVKSASKIETAARLIAFHFDSPQFSIPATESALTLTGWVIGKRSPVAKIAIFHHKNVILETSVNLSRPDVAEVYPLPHAHNSGFSTTVATSFIPSQVTLTISAISLDGEAVNIGTIC